MSGTASRPAPAAPFAAGLLAWSLLFAIAAPAQIAGRVETIDGRVLEGRMGVATTGAVTVATAEGDVTFDLAELLEFTPTKATPRHLTALHRIWLRSGQELPCTELALADASPPAVQATLPCGATLQLPIGMLAALRHAGAQRPEPALLAEDLRDRPKNDDVLFVVKDERAQRSLVRVTGVAQGQVSFDLRGKTYEFGFDGVAAIVFGQNTGFAPDRQPKPRTVVAFTTGERLEGKLLEFGERVRLRLDEGVEVVAAATAVAGLTVASDRLVRLHELTPTVEQTPAFDRVWPWTVGRSVAGPGFKLGGKDFARGIGMVPRTRLTFDLGGRFDTFEAVLGIDDRAGPAADAIFRVIVDDRVVFEERFDRRTAPLPMSLPLARCQRLALEVDFGANYDLGDHCVFADARVVQK